MARILFTGWPLHGQLYPQVSVALALRERGHEVAFYSGESARPLLEPEGFPVFPLEDVPESEVWDSVREMELQSVGLGRLTHFGQALRRWMVETIPGQVTDIRRVIARWRPDAIACDPTVWAPLLVLSETEGLPVAVSSFLNFCLIPGPAIPPLGLGLPSPRTFPRWLLARSVAGGLELLAGGIRRRVDEVRAGFGLGPLPCPINHYPGRLPLYLVPSIRELDFMRQDLPPSVHYVGPCVWNKRSREEAPAWLAELPTDVPIVHATEGTIHAQDPLVLRTVGQGLAGRDAYVILTTGRHRQPSELNLGAPAANVRVEQWVNHTDLLPRCAVVVTNGGTGTIMAALQAGLPLVVVPTHWDKPDNAQRLVEAGAGVRLDPWRCNPRTMREAIEQVLGDSRYRAAARHLQRRLAEEGGPRRSAELLEALAAGRLASARSR